MECLFATLLAGLLLRRYALVSRGQVMVMKIMIVLLLDGLFGARLAGGLSVVLRSFVR